MQQEWFELGKTKTYYKRNIPGIFTCAILSIS